MQQQLLLLLLLLLLLHVCSEDAKLYLLLKLIWPVRAETSRFEHEL